MRWNGVTEPLWFYDRTQIEFVKTDKDVDIATEFQPGLLVLSTDKRIRKTVMNGYVRFKGRDVSQNLISCKQRDGNQCCSSCKIVRPIECFQSGLSERIGKSTRKCKICRKQSFTTDNNKSTKIQERKKYIMTRRVEIIRHNGCQFPTGCPLNQIIDLLTDEHILGEFEFNHRDANAKIFALSSYKCYTDNQASNHGFNTWKELWEAEAKKCEVLCCGHHIMHSKTLRTSTRKRAYE